MTARGGHDDAAVPKYALTERERRWLVDPARCPLDPAAPQLLIEDQYLDGTRLRLRRMVESDSGRTIFKLTKKYATADAAARPIVTVYLTEQEYAVFAALPAHSIVKRRFRIDGFSVDRFIDPPTLPMIVEIECSTADALGTVIVPDWAMAEITHDPAYEGGALAVRNL